MLVPSAFVAGYRCCRLCRFVRRDDNFACPGRGLSTMNMVSEYEDVRPLEGMSAPLKVRHHLRQLFDRWLSRPPQPRPVLRQEEAIDDLSLLSLCAHYRVEYPGGRDDVAANWNASAERIAEGAPTFEELVGRGWVFFDGGRWVMQNPPMGQAAHITYPSPSTKLFLETLSKPRLVATNDAPPADADALAGRLRVEGWPRGGGGIARDPEWVAGRLWEQMCPLPIEPESKDASADDIDKAFLAWVAWCDVIGSGGRWNINWNSIRARYAREAAQRVLTRQKIWGSWDTDTWSYLDVLQKTYAIPREHLRFSMLPRKAPPRTLVARIDWLGWREIEPLVMERLGNSSAAFAFNLLCTELERTGSGAGLVDSAKLLFSLAARHPMALQLLAFRKNASPALLVDMLMDAHMAPLAVKLVVEWQQQRSRETDQDAAREAQTKGFAVQDALALLAHHLKVRTLDLEECASLVTWCYEVHGARQEPAADARRLIGRQLVAMVARQEAETQSIVLQHLASQVVTERNVRRAEFWAVVDGLRNFRKAQGAEGATVVNVYAEFAREMNLDWTDASSLPLELAAQLVATALAQDLSAQEALLVPFDSAKALRNATGDDKYTVRNNVAQSLRTHIRLLARAVAGWPDGEVPAKLVDTFQTLVSRSSIEHPEKGRVGALTDRYSPRRHFGGEQGSPAIDLAAAWRRLGDGQREPLLASLLQSDDPVLLAELGQNLPAAAKAVIHDRLRQLEPDEASEVWTWTEVQQRVTALLEVGQVELARRHYDAAVPALDDAAPQFQLDFFGLGLRLLMKEKDWSAIDSVEVPATLDAGTAQQARNQLEFYRATSQMLRPGGRLADARAVLQRLARQPGAGSAYQENMFAIAIQQLLGPTLHPLTGEDKAAGETLLAEINAVLGTDTSAACRSLAANRALLLFTLQRSSDALEAMAPWRQGKRTADIEYIAALATAELGRSSDAMAILDAAILESGADDRLIELKNYLEAKVAPANVAQAAVAVSESVDRLGSIRAALYQLTQLNVSDVGDLLGPSDGKLPGYLVREVSSALGALQVMSAMLRPRRTAGNDAKLEDDLNSTIRHYLARALSVPRWHVSEQPPGGATSNGNPGRRDAAIYAFNTEIAIYEALVCSSVNKADIKKHFDKLFSYGRCQVYFLAIYSYAKETQPLLDYLKEMLERQVPPGYEFVDCKPVTRQNHATRGYLVTYRVDHEEVVVALLVAELRVLGEASTTA